MDNLEALGDLAANSQRRQNNQLLQQLIAQNRGVCPCPHCGGGLPMVGVTVCKNCRKDLFWHGNCVAKNPQAAKELHDKLQVRAAEQKINKVNDAIGRPYVLFFLAIIFSLWPLLSCYIWYDANKSLSALGAAMRGEGKSINLFGVNVILCAYGALASLAFGVLYLPYSLYLSLTVSPQEKKNAPKKYEQARQVSDNHSDTIREIAYRKKRCEAWGRALDENQPVEMDVKQVFVRRENKTHGPFSYQQIRKAIQSGKLTASDEIGHDEEPFVEIKLSPFARFLRP